MLHSVKALRGFAIAATDGALGSVRDVYFDDGQWMIRYFVVDTGGWPHGYDVLLSPLSVTAAEWPMRALRIKLTREQVRNSPGIDAARPVSRQHEAELANYYELPFYWAGPLHMSAIYPGVVEKHPLTEQERLAIREEIEQEHEASDPRLRSADEVIGYHLHARDRSIGHVADFLLDERDWSIKLIVVDTRNWWPGKHVLISPERIERVSWDDKSVFVNATREEIEHSPEYDETNPPQAGVPHDMYRPRLEKAGRRR